MEPVTHALLGACAAQAALGSPHRDFTGRYTRRHLWLVGALGGLLPDLDYFIGSIGDPLLAIEYHRHFTHALIFIPLGGLLAALPWLCVKRQRLRWRLLWAAGCLGWATHGVLDACTNYGTHLLWPFSEARSAWQLITTINPPLTLLLLLGLLLALRHRTRTAAACGLLLAGLYIGLAAFQQARAIDAQGRIAAQRGQAIARGDVFPTVGNPVVWRSLYESAGVLHIDRLRVTGGVEWKAGYSVPLLREADLPPTLLANERVRRDFGRFSYFSAGWVARAPDDATFIGDARYSLVTEKFAPIWGVRFHPEQPQPTEWVDRTRQNRVPVADLWAEISGSVASAYVNLPQ